jgi:hypothetical protein
MYLMAEGEGQGQFTAVLLTSSVPLAVMVMVTPAASSRAVAASKPPPVAKIEQDDACSWLWNSDIIMKHGHLPGQTGFTSLQVKEWRVRTDDDAGVVVDVGHGLVCGRPPCRVERGAADFDYHGARADCGPDFVLSVRAGFGGHILSEDQADLALREKRPLLCEFSLYPYICPEPVWVK